MQIENLEIELVPWSKKLGSSRTEHDTYHVGVGGQESRPESLAHPAVLPHDGNLGVDLLDDLQRRVEVAQHVLDARCGHGLVGANLVVVGNGLVDERERVGVGVAAELDVVDGLLDHLEAVVHVGRVEPPVVVANGLTVVQAVAAAGQRVQVDDDVHAVLDNGVVGDQLEPDQLVAVVELRSRHVHPCLVRHRHAQQVDADGSKLVDVGKVVVAGIVLLQEGAALGAEVLAQAPLILGDRRRDLLVPPGLVAGVLEQQPVAQVHAVGLERGPVEVLVCRRQRPEVGAAVRGRLRSQDLDLGLDVIGQRGDIPVENRQHLATRHLGKCGIAILLKAADQGRSVVEQSLGDARQRQRQRLGSGRVGEQASGEDSGETHGEGVSRRCRGMGSECAWGSKTTLLQTEPAPAL